MHQQIQLHERKPLVTPALLEGRREGGKEGGK